VNRAYAFVAFGLYMLAFGVAFLCVFTFPLGALALVILGVLSLAFVALGRDTLQAIERWLSRRSMQQGRCPACRMGPMISDVMHGAWRCGGCLVCFESDGSELRPPDTDAIEMTAV